MDIVIDCSYIISEFMPDEADSSIDLSPHQIYVPAIFMVECMSAIIMAFRRNRMTKDESEVAVEKLLQLPFNIDKLLDPSCLREVARLSTHYSLTPYDASYLELAIRMDAKLLTLDKALARAAKSSGIEVVA